MLTFAPSRTEPELGASAPVRRLTSVVLPAPLAPTMPIRSRRITRSEKSRTTAALAVSLAHPLGVDHQRARGFRVLRDHGGRAGWPQRLAPLASEIGELADAAHVALAPRGDAVAHPVLFLDDLAVELVALELLLLELCVAPGLERAEALVEPAGAAAIEPDRGLRQVGEQSFVVADESERRAAFGEARLQPLDGDEIEVIGRLVQEQDVGLGAQRP